MASQGRGDGRRHVTATGPAAPVSLFDRLDVAVLRRATAGLTDAVAFALTVLLEAGAIAHDPLDPAWPDRDRLLVASSLAPAEVARLLERGGGAGWTAPDEEVLREVVAVARAGRATGGGARTWCALPAAALTSPSAAALLVEAGSEPLAGLVALVVDGEAEALLVAAGWTVEHAADRDLLAVLGAADRALDVPERPHALVLEGAAD